MPKLPGKFDDISKTASSVLGDDFQCKDFELKSKQKTQLNGATCEVTVGQYQGKEGAKTNFKLNLKFPKIYSGLPGIAIDKFEIDSALKYKVESSVSNELHKVDGLKIDVKGDLNNQAVAATYTGIKDASIKVETKNFSATDFTAECLYGGVGGAIIGAQFNGLNCPNVGVNYATGDFFASLFAKGTFSEFTPHLHYKVSDDIKVACTYQQGGKGNGNWSAAGSFALGDVNLKAKLESSMNLSVAVKKDLAKGTTIFGGVGYNLNSGDMGYGAKVNIE